MRSLFLPVTFALSISLFLVYLVNKYTVFNGDVFKGFDFDQDFDDYCNHPKELLFSVERLFQDQKDDSSRAEQLTHFRKLLPSFGSLKRLHEKAHLNASNISRIVFLKTHKTGSTTLTGILWRELCLHQRKNCFLPPMTSPGRTWDFNLQLHRGLVLKHGTGVTGGKPPFDVWVHHAKYHQLLFTAVVPEPDLILSIVRRPSLRFQSAWYWYQHSDRMDGIPLKEFIDRFAVADSSGRKLLSSEAIGSSPFHSLDTNTNTATEVDTGRRLDHRFYCQDTNAGPQEQTFTSGSNSSKGPERFAKKTQTRPPPASFKYRTGLDATSEEVVGQSKGTGASMKAFQARFEDRLIAVLRSEMLLLVCDRFDESLLVLQQRLQWSIQTLLYFRQKVQLQSVGASISTSSPSASISARTYNISRPLSESDLLTLDAMQPYDSLLYTVANHMLDLSIKAYTEAGGHFENDLRILRRNLKEMEDFCRCSTNPQEQDKDRPRNEHKHRKNPNSKPRPNRNGRLDHQHHDKDNEDHHQAVRMTKSGDGSPDIGYPIGIKRSDRGSNLGRSSGALDNGGASSCNMTASNIAKGVDKANPLSLIQEQCSLLKDGNDQAVKRAWNMLSSRARGAVLE